MQKTEHGIEVGQKVEINGRTYWVTGFDQTKIEFMLDPDETGRPYYGKKTDWGTFWRIFFCIVLAVILLKFVF